MVKLVSLKFLYQRILSLIDHPHKFLKTKTYDGPNRIRHDSGASIGKSERRSVALEEFSAKACVV
jgi:hypothetical protein